MRSARRNPTGCPSSSLTMQPTWWQHVALSSRHQATSEYWRLLVHADTLINFACVAFLTSYADHCRHIVPFRCMMHAFGLVLNSAVASPWPQGLIAQAQKVVVYFFQLSHRPGDELQKARDLLQVLCRLQSANKTRMTSTVLMVISVMKNEMALKHVVQQHAAIISAEVAAIIKDRAFREVCHLLQPVLCPLN
jgi:hypothetical protein